MTNKSILLSSGGMDSTTLAYWLQSKNIEFIPLFINYGQHCVDTEYETLLSVLPNELKEKIIVINVSDIYKHSQSRLIVEPDLWNDKVRNEDFFLPYRNLLLMTVGASFAQSIGADSIYAAFINSNNAKEIDCSSKFFSDLSTVLSDYGTVDVKLPFKDYSKYDVAKLGIALKAPIGKTFSCQASSDIPCGACPNCVDRLEALEKLSNS